MREEMARSRILSSIVVGSILLCFTAMRARAQTESETLATVPEMPIPGPVSPSQMIPVFPGSSSRIGTAEDTVLQNRLPKSEGRFSIRGQAFVKLMTGADNLAGMKIQLIKDEALLPSWQLAREESGIRRKAFKARAVGREIVSIQSRISEIRNAKTSREKLLKDKQAEITKCQKERWTHFTYVDPVTDQAQAVKVDSSTFLMMHSRLVALQSLLPKYDTAILDLKKQIVNKAAEFRTIGAEYDGLTAEQVLVKTEPFLPGIHTEKELHYRNTSDFIQALDAATVETTTVHNDGRFLLPGIGSGNYHVYAYHHLGGDKITWLRPVEWKLGVPREVILSSQNALNWERAIETDRIEGLAEATLRNVEAP